MYASKCVCVYVGGVYIYIYIYIYNVNPIHPCPPKRGTAIHKVVNKRDRQCIVQANAILSHAGVTIFAVEKH